MTKVCLKEFKDCVEIENGNKVTQVDIDNLLNGDNSLKIKSHMMKFIDKAMQFLMDQRQY